MTRLDGARHPNPAGAAIDFLTMPGRAERVLATHHDRGNGRCAGCFVHLSVWPCSVARLAQAAVAQRGTQTSTPWAASSALGAVTPTAPPRAAPRPSTATHSPRKATA